MTKTSEHGESFGRLKRQKSLLVHRRPPLDSSIIMQFSICVYTKLAPVVHIYRSRRAGLRWRGPSSRGCMCNFQSLRVLHGK